MPKWGEYDKVEPTPDVEGNWVIFSMKFNGDKTYILNKNIDRSIEETLAGAISSNHNPHPRLITISYSDGSETVLRYVEQVPVTI
jgi:hypothetical protein